MLASLESHFDAFVEGEVCEGRYATAEDVVRAGLRLLEQQDPQLQAMLAAIDEGEASADIEVTDHEAFCASVRARRSKVISA